MIYTRRSQGTANVNKNVDPIRDLEIIETEMKLADLESIQKRIDKKNKKNISDEQLKILEIALNCINEDKNMEVILDSFCKNHLLLENHFLENENEYVHSGIILHNGNENGKWIFNYAQYGTQKHVQTL